MDSRFFDFKIFAVPDADSLRSRCRGGNARKVLVVYELGEEGDQQELELFLSRVLTAAGLDLHQDVALINVTPAERISFSALRHSHGVGTVISFGLSPQRLGLNLDLDRYQPLTYRDCNFLFAGHLAFIYDERQRGGKEHSSALWQALQILFPKS